MLPGGDLPAGDRERPARRQPDRVPPASRTRGWPRSGRDGGRGGRTDRRAVPERPRVVGDGLLCRFSAAASSGPFGDGRRPRPRVDRGSRGWDDVEGEIEPKSLKGTRTVPVPGLLRIFLPEQCGPHGPPWRRARVRPLGEPAVLPFERDCRPGGRRHGARRARLVPAAAAARSVDREDRPARGERHTLRLAD